MSRSRSWCFTLNNYVQEDEARLRALAPEVGYLIFGREIGENGTPHLQGYIFFKNAIALRSAKAKISDRAHLESSRGTPKQASDYCKKDGNYEEYGELPKQGKRTDWERYKAWVLELGVMPTKRDIVLAFPALYARHLRACLDYAEALLPAPRLTEATPRFGWQANAAQMVSESPHDRRINFVVDPVGNTGKSWFCKWCLTNYPNETQVFRIGKRDDLAYAINIEKTIFLFDIPRGQMMYLQYSVLESLKDRMIFSPKYESSFKILKSVPHVYVFTNEEPDMNALSADRYNIIRV